MSTDPDSDSPALSPSPPDATGDPSSRRGNAADAIPTVDVATRLPSTDDDSDETAATATISGRPNERALERGVSIGRYLILDRIGAGGMGVVYQAYDPELDRRIAIKLMRIRPGSAGTASQPRARLLREAQALAQLSHPNVIAVYDVGTFGDDVFLAMELVEGKTLRKWLKQGVRSRQRILEVMVAAGRGLAAAHRVGLVHRDFKPENVIVGDDGRVRVLDFGLARAVGGGIEVDTPDADSSLDSDTSRRRLVEPLTVAGRLVGTPAYMAPEQHLGHEVDERADQFAFCVALFEALYGMRPFPGKRSDEVSRNACAGRIAPPPAGIRMPASLRRILARGLAVEPDERFPSMEALLHPLARQPTSRARVLASTVLVVALVVATSLAVLRSRSPNRPCRGAEAKIAAVWNPRRGAAVEQAFLASGRGYAVDTFGRVVAAVDDYATRWVVMHTEACEATRIRGEQSAHLLDLRIACLDRRRDELGSLVELFAAGPDGALVDRALQAVADLVPLESCADRALLTAEVPPPDDPATRDQVALLNAELSAVMALHLAGKYAAGLDRLGSVVEQATELGYPPLVAEAENLRGDLEVETGNHAAAEAGYLAAARAAAAGRDDAAAARALTNLLWVTGNLQVRPAEAAVYAELARNAITRAGQPAGLRARFANTYGAVLFRRGDYAGARRELSAAIAINEETYGVDDYRLASTLNQLGEVARALGENDLALAHYRRALAVQEQMLGPDHPDVSVLVNNVGSVLWDQGKYDEARPYLERSLAIDEGALGPDHPRVATSLANLGGMLNAQGRASEGLPYLERAVAIQEKALGPDHPDLAMSLHNLGSARYGAGQFEPSRVTCQRALEIFERALGPDHPHLAFPLIGVGNALMALHRPKDALPNLERALAIQEKALGPAHPHLTYTLTSLGQCWNNLGQPARAVPPLERALKLRESGEFDPTDLAETRFLLAAALWRSRIDRPRALGLARAARAAWSAAGPDYGSNLEEADRWLQAHGEE